MKKLFISSTIMTFFLLNQDISAMAQCDFQVHSQDCIRKVQNGFIYVKSFNLNGQDGDQKKIEYSYVMTKDTQYYLNICSPEEDTDGIIVTIYDSKRNTVSTNYTKNKFFPALIFQCNATGIYYITYTFKNSKNNCGGSVLAFKK